MHLVYLQNLCITIVFDFSWGDYNTWRIWKQWLRFFGGAGGGGYEVRYGLGNNNEYQSPITIVSKLQERVSILNII